LIDHQATGGRQAVVVGPDRAVAGGSIGIPQDRTREALAVDGEDIARPCQTAGETARDGRARGLARGCRASRDGRRRRRRGRGGRGRGGRGGGSGGAQGGGATEEGGRKKPRRKKKGRASPGQGPGAKRQKFVGLSEGRPL